MNFFLFPGKKRKGESTFELHDETSMKNKLIFCEKPPIS